MGHILQGGSFGHYMSPKKVNRPCAFSGFSRPDFSTDPGHSILLKIGEVKSNHFLWILWICGCVDLYPNPQNHIYKTLQDCNTALRSQGSTRVNKCQQVKINKGLN